MMINDKIIQLQFQKFYWVIKFFNYKREKTHIFAEILEGKSFRNT